MRQPPSTACVADDSPQQSMLDVVGDEQADGRLETGLVALQYALARLQTQVRQEQTKNRVLTLINESLCEELLAQEQQFQLIQSMAYYDTLTGLPNRNLLLDRFRLAQANAVRDQKQIAVLFLDINNFKTYNDSYGHSYGDMLLQTLAARVLSVLRASDTVCRYGGDEFLVLLPDVKGREDAIEVIEKIHHVLALPNPDTSLPAQTLQTSIGLAMYPDDGDSFTELVRKADLAMYFGKNYCHRDGVTPTRLIIPPAAEAVSSNSVTPAGKARQSRTGRKPQQTD